MQPTDRLAVVLEAEAWNGIMRVLSTAPYREVAFLIQEIQRQCQGQAMASLGQEVATQTGLKVVPNE